MAPRPPSARPATPPSGRAGHRTRGHAPPWSGLTGHGTRRHVPPSFGRAPHGTRVRSTGRAHLAVIPAGHDGPGTPRRHPTGHATRVGSIRRLPSAAGPPAARGSRPTYSCQLRRWRACEGWRTAERGSCQAMRVRLTPGAPGVLGRRERVKVAGCRVANRPKRFAG